MLSGSGVVTNEKEAMQELNDRLATYLEKVRSLEQENRRLEVQIREVMAKRGPSTRDWSHYWDVIEELRDKVGSPRPRGVRGVPSAGGGSGGLSINPAGGGAGWTLHPQDVTGVRPDVPGGFTWGVKGHGQGHGARRCQRVP